MKKLLTLSLLFVFALSSTYAQDISKEAKTAKKLISAYNMSKDADKLAKAKDAVMMLFKNDDANSNFDALVAKGDLYAALTSEDVEGNITSSVTGVEYVTKNPGSSIVAVQTYLKAIDAAEKSSQTKSLLTKLLDVHNLAGQEFSAEYNAARYGYAYNASRAVLESYDLLSKKGKTSAVIADEKGLSDYKFYSGIAAYYGEEMEAAASIMEDLKASGSKDPTVYKVLFDIYSREEQEEKAVEALRTGRELEPDNKELLFAEIDYLIKKKDNDKVQVLLQEAVEKDPENPAIYQALSGVFSDLFKKSIDTGATSEEYFQKSKGYAEKAFELDNTYYDAQIILAELHYNKAVSVATAINALPYDSSKEGERKYNEMVKEMEGLYAAALPYCKKAEKIDPNRKVALLFLQEILAKTGDLETSTKIKERVTKLEAGEKFDTSFFN